MFGPELVGAFERFKALWDPDWKMNPGKVVRPNPITSDLRLGTTYRPPKPRTFFRYPDDRGTSAGRSFAASGSGNAAATSTARCARATW